MVVGWLDKRAARKYPLWSTHLTHTAHRQSGLRTVTEDGIGSERMLSSASGSVTTWVMRGIPQGVTIGWIVKTVDPDDPLKTMASDPGRLQCIVLPER